MLELIEQIVGIGIPFVDVARERGENAHIQASVNARVERAKIGKRHLHDIAARLLRVRALEDVAAEQQMSTTPAEKRSERLSGSGNLPARGYEISLAGNDFAFVVDEEAASFAMPKSVSFTSPS